MGDVATNLYGVLSIIIAALIGFAGHWLANRQQKQSNATADWVSYTQTLREDLQTVRDQLAEITTRMDRVEAALEAEERRSWSAITYIRRLLRWITETMPDHTPPAPPDLLKDEL
jgi:hypothetical protein